MARATNARNVDANWRTDELVFLRVRQALGAKGQESMKFRLVDETTICASCMGDGVEYIHKFDGATGEYVPQPRNCQACGGLGTYDRIGVETIFEEDE